MQKLIYISLVLSLIQLHSFAQESRKFEVVEQVKSTPLKNQQSSGTCWSFATTSFIETEALRLGKEAVSLSPIFYVTPTYLGKAEKYIERKGKSYFAGGDLTFSVLAAYQKYGAIPEEVYNGVIEGDWQHDHLEMDELLAVMVESIGASGYGRIKPNSWKKAIEGVLQAYLGKAPSRFLYNGREYTPQSFAHEFVGINPEDYVEITSYQHLPFYKKSVLNIPANWNNHKYLNLPIDDFEAVINHALESGYSLCWDGDASEDGFNFDTGMMELSMAQETSSITQSLRQITFDNQSTTDDHNMHMIGIALDETGKRYYLMKNSEGENELDGFMYMSKNALLLKTISVMVHKDAIPAAIKSKI